ncbi:Hypothetical predicted protein [Olea europaea subsp. europaea]|uniref:Uncharacterized protein n=1 Tax=Olea europaea subsp. europaea TaxID=158383 RepID=A0A8S0RG14_OLEEU|nr:Hypothetical predicted protein [Olea europaea subsp. europaea]
MKFDNKVIHIQEFFLALAFTGIKLLAHLSIDLDTGITKLIVFCNVFTSDRITSSGFIELGTWVATEMIGDTGFISQTPNPTNNGNTR